MSADKHLTIPGALEWDSGSVERFTIATLRYAGGSEHDVRYVSERDYDAALAREAALREELVKLADDYCEKVDAILDLQQRLTVAEQRNAELVDVLRSVADYTRHPDYDWFPSDRDAVEAALKPAAEGEGS